MEAMKIVSQLEDGSDSINLFGGFTQVVIERGTWETAEKKGLCARVSGGLCPPDKVFFAHGKQPDDGQRCKRVLLVMPGEKFIQIATDARIYFLGKNGQTIEAIY